MLKIKRLKKSFVYAWRGLIKTFKEEQNFKVHTFVTIIVVLLGILCGISASEWALLVIVIGLVLLLEIMNSAVERVSDVLKPRINTYVKEIKDIMAAGVMLAVIIAVLVGLIIFWPYIFT